MSLAGNLSAKQATLTGLRLIRDWSNLAAKLPSPQSALLRLSPERLDVRLDRDESHVWELALGEMSISKIARNLGLETSRVQQIGFRLSVIGLMQEVSAEPSQPPVDRSMDVPKLVSVNSGNVPTPVSTSFFSNLIGFLKRKG